MGCFQSAPEQLEYPGQQLKAGPPSLWKEGHLVLNHHALLIGMQLRGLFLSSFVSLCAPPKEVQVFLGFCVTLHCCAYTRCSL